MTINLKYGVEFGKGDASDWIWWEVELDEEAEREYLRYKMFRLCLEDSAILCAVRDEAYEAIKEYETGNLCDYDDEYALECMGQVPVDPDDINELVKKRDRHTLEFFELTELTEEELDDWDANDIEDYMLPDACDFYPDFKPTNPFDEGWSLNVEFCDYEDDYVDGEEARESLLTLFKQSEGDYTVVKKYIAEFEHGFGYSSVDIRAMAAEVAAGLGITDFALE